jgi:hypothetical protein
MPRRKSVEIMTADEELGSLLRWAERMRFDNVATALRRIIIKIGFRPTRRRSAFRKRC